MPDSPDVKQLLLQVDATTELLRRNLDKAQAEIGKFQQGAQRTLDQTDRNFAQLGQGLDRIAPAVVRANAQIGTIGATAKRIELQVQASSSAMAVALERAGGLLASAFAVEKVKEYADGYTRFTNSLKVAGLEGAKLAGTQEALFATAQRYGVSLEAIGDLYGRAAQASHGIGASQGDVLKFSNAVAAAVKINGGSAESAKDSIIQLGQALDSGVVHAQEYNSVTMGLYPLLQAVAQTSDKYAGSVSNIRKEMLAGKLTSSEFFAEIVKAQSVLEGRAGSATLTIGASLQVLNNALGKYIGQSDAGLSATDRFGQGVKLLADNLDSVLPAVASLAIAYGAVKAGGMAFAGIDASLGAIKGTTAAILLGNAAYTDRIASTARVAVAAQEAAAAELTASRETVAARQAEQAVLAEQITAERALASERRAAALFAARSNITNGGADLASSNAARNAAANDASFAAQRLTALRARQAVVDGELAIAESELAAATVTSAAATEAATTATAAATFGARAAAAASALFAGALDLVAGALPLIAIAAVVGAIIHYRSETAEAAAQTKAFADRHKEAAEFLERTANFAHSAASAITQVGNNAAGATGKMAAFANQVGEAAAKLKDLAEQRRKASLGDAKDKFDKAGQTVRETDERIAARRQNRYSHGELVGTYSTDPAADARDRAARDQAVRDQAGAKQRYHEIGGADANRFLADSEKNGGRDVPGELAQARRDLTIAQAGTDKAESNRLKAKVYELTQYQAYIKRGFSVESATSQSQSDSQRLQAAGQGKLDAASARTGAAAGRRADAQARAAGRRQAAAVKDDANDTRAYAAAEREANDKIASANADLTNSAALRAQIERDRVEADRKSRNQELEQQAKAGRFGDPKTAAARVKTLQDLNDKAAKAQTDVIDLKERRQQDDDAAALATHQLEIRRGQIGDEQQFALTTTERAAKELELLDLQKQEEKIRLDRILAANSGASEGQRAQAQVDSDTLDSRYATKGAAIAAQNAGPLEQYKRQLVGNVGDMKEALQGVEADGIKNVGDGLVGLVSGTETAASAFKRMASSIIADLARIAVEKAILTIVGLPLGLAGGGKIPGRADGGKITGAGTGTSDSILAMVDGRDPLMVSNGESIVTAQATRDHWPLIDAMNKGKLRGLATGGRVGPAIVTQPAVPDMRAIGAAQRAATQLQVVRVITEASPYFDQRVVHVAGPMAQAAIPAGAQQAGQDAADYRWSQIP